MVTPPIPLKKLRNKTYFAVRLSKLTLLPQFTEIGALVS